MKCAACQTENSEGRKFCRKCGAKLARICPACETDNLPDDCFCGECGQSLTASAAKPARTFSFDENFRKSGNSFMEDVACLPSIIRLYQSCLARAKALRCDGDIELDAQCTKEQLTRAIDIFRECGADGWVEKYEREIALI